MRDPRLAQIALACMVEPGSGAVAQLVAEHGPVEALARVRVSTADRAAVPGRITPDQVPAMVAELARTGVRVVVPGDDEYPSQLGELPEPPLALWVRGPLDLRAAALRSVALVGSRACTAYGERVAVGLGGELAERDWAVVSGGAFGIDAAAHRGALGAPGPTIAVLACGIDRAYPRAHEALLARIADTGVVLAELPPGSEPLRFRFLSRNRLIAGLSRGTVVVEAALRSGAMATANRAMALGRVVMAVPGPVTSMASAGANRLLVEQSARAVTSAGEVCHLLLGGEPSDPDRAVPPVPTDLDQPSAQVLAALPARGSRSVEEVAARAGMPEVQALALLGVLEIQGLAERLASGWRRSR